MATGIQLKSESKKIYPLCYFPVGAIFISTSEFSPASMYIGEWEKIEGRFLVGAGGLYNVGDQGGLSQVALTVSTMPSHTHYVSAYYGSGSAYGKFHQMGKTSSDYADLTKSTQSTGGDVAHDNMPPYKVVHIWRRVA